MIYLDVEDLLHIARRLLDGRVEVRDIDFPESAAGRPRTTVFGDNAYPTLPLEAAALLHSITHDHSLVDGNQRLGLVA